MTDLHANIRCPNCGHRVRIKVREMVPGRSKRCPYCATTIQFPGDDGRQVQRALDHFERELKRISRKLTIKL